MGALRSAFQMRKSRRFDVADWWRNTILCVTAKSERVHPVSRAALECRQREYARKYALLDSRLHDVGAATDLRAGGEWLILCMPTH